MGDVPSDVGYLTVTAFAIEAIADSNDTGPYPDAIPLDATVVLAPVNLPNSRGYVIAAADHAIIQLGTIKCQLIDGVLYAPNDGHTYQPGESSETAGVNIVAPNQAAIDLQNWYWEAQFQPPAGADWKAFTVFFTGSPGDTVPLASAALSMSSLTGKQLIQQPGVWVVEGTTIPPGAQPGQYLLDSTTDDLYLIGA